MSEEMTLAPELIPANVHYMQQMMYLAQGYADWDEDDAGEVAARVDGGLEVV